MKTILFVEDDPVIVQAYRGPLQKAGYRVEVADDGLAAMRAMLPLRPAMVLLDMMMPKLDGTYVLKFIRSRPELKETKVVVLSNVTNADIAKDLISQNPDRVFLKSEASPKELVKAINELVGGTEKTGSEP